MMSSMTTTDSLQVCVDEDYIDMELSSSSPRSREFEFQMCSGSKEREAKTCTADELFYKGKLLPLHLITSSIAARDKLIKEPFEESDVFCSMPLACATAPCTNTNNTPSDSCNISPSESCRVSCELNPDDYFFEWSTELSSFLHHRDRSTIIRKKSLAQKLKLMRQHSSLAQKLKASRAYLKSLFNKTACSDEKCAKAKVGVEDEKIDKCSEFAKKRTFEFMGRVSYPTIAAILKHGGNKNGIDDNAHRRSFSGAIKRHSPAKCLSSSSSNSSSGSSSSSSSFSLNSNSLNEVNLTRRSSSAAENEDSIEAAIAHCKKSHKGLDLSKELEICHLSASDVVNVKHKNNRGPCR